MTVTMIVYNTKGEQVNFYAGDTAKRSLIANLTGYFLDNLPSINKVEKKPTFTGGYKVNVELASGFVYCYEVTEG